jgi:outer membrane protein assembly factor BamB
MGETILTHDNIDNRAGSGRFGKLWDRGFTHTPEQVYAAPLYYNGAVFAATERNWVYALNADNGSVIWERPLALSPSTPDPALNQSQYLGCGDISPWHGVTGTPVLDPDTETLYVVDVTLGAGNQQLYRMYALDIYTGTTRMGWPVTLGGTYRGRTFDATRLTQRGALTMLTDSSQAKWVYATFSSRCDFGAWHG